MKIVCLVLFALLAATCAIPEDEPRSSEAGQIKPTDGEVQIPVEIVYTYDEPAKQPLRREKRFLLTKLLLAKAALGAGALAVLSSPYQFRKTVSYQPSGGTYNFYKTYRPLNIPASPTSSPTTTTTAAPGTSSNSISSAASPITYSWTKPIFPVFGTFNFYKTYTPLSSGSSPSGSSSSSSSSPGSSSTSLSSSSSSNVSTSSSLAPASTSPSNTGTPVAGGTLTWQSTYLPVQTSGTVTKTVTGFNTASTASE